MTSIIVVCTGNICRSPAAEMLLDAYVGDHVSVHSAGVRAMEGQPIPHEMLTLLAQAGFDATSHRSRPLTPDLANSATIAVGMTVAHRAQIAQCAPSHLRTTFTFDELVRTARGNVPLEGSTVAERVTRIPLAVTRFRPQLASTPATDVPDPYRRSRKEYAAAFDLIASGCAAIASWLRGDNDPGGPATK
ncbi:arsenate reductase/protein-tyrosine-phosphatase family protein [Demequina globuliformis]|uniref:arsenate reductase/protein-tyrosine-phosphatase family protein n=1 Tax=Demequina globuliformis TaxID=676202 RepID=UPI000782F552|nr:low molecular weight phosphatase family protein [Demequina globuliformis]